MKALLTVAVMLSITPMAASASEYKTNRFGDLIIPYGQQPPTAQQRRADPLLDRYPGLTPREFGTRALTANEQFRQGQPAPTSMCRTVTTGNTYTTVCY